MHWIIWRNTCNTHLVLIQSLLEMRRFFFYQHLGLKNMMRILAAFFLTSNHKLFITHRKKWVFFYIHSQKGMKEQRSRHGLRCQLRNTKSILATRSKWSQWRHTLTGSLTADPWRLKAPLCECIGRKEARKDARKEGRKVTQPPVHTCSLLLNRLKWQNTDCTVINHRSVTHQGLDDRTVMHWWWIIPPWRNGKAHSLPVVVSTGDRQLQHVHTSWTSTG